MAKITKGGLEADDYLYVSAATLVSTAPANTTGQLKVRKLKKTDVDFKETASIIQNALAIPVRNMESDVPIHKNEQGRLPTYPNVPITQVQPNLEYLVPALKSTSLGASRIVVDVAGQRVYLSYHYGDASTRADTIPKFAKKEKLSAFVELDPATWTLAAILGDAATWWTSMNIGVAGT